MIMSFNENNVKNIINDIVDNFVNLANHSKGLCVIKRVIQKSSNEFIIRKIVNIITENALLFVHNPFGNYAIQTALDVKFYKLLIFFYFHSIFRYMIRAFVSLL
jgi:hypothetical protein